MKTAAERASYYRRWRLANRTRLQEKRREYRRSHANQLQIKDRKWREANPGYSRAYARRCLGTRTRFLGSVTCPICGQEGGCFASTIVNNKTGHSSPLCLSVCHGYMLSRKIIANHYVEKRKHPEFYSGFGIFIDPNERRGGSRNGGRRSSRREDGKS